MTTPDAPRRGESDVSLRNSRLLAYRIAIVIGAGIIMIAVLNLLGILSDVLTFLAVGSISAFVASPIVNVLERHGVKRGVGSLLGIAVVVVCVCLLFVVVIPVVISQLVVLLGDLSRQLSEAGRWFAEIEREYDIIGQITAHIQIDQLISEAQRFFSGVAGAAFDMLRDGFIPLVNSVANAVFIVFLGFVLAYWLVCDYPRINEEICQVLGEGKADDYRLVLAVTAQSVGGYIRVTVINSIIQGGLAFLGFWIVGHPYAGVMGLLSGILNFIPVVGPSISAIIATAIALLYSPIMAFWTMVMAVLSQNITDNVITPKINQSAMQIHPVLSLTALVIGSTLLGGVGMIIAIPLCAVIKSLFIFYYETKTGRQIVSYDGALFKGTPFLDKDGRAVPAYDALGNDGFANESELIESDAVPEASAIPKPDHEIDNPWARIMSAVTGSSDGQRGSGADGGLDSDPRDDVDSDDGR